MPKNCGRDKRPEYGNHLGGRKGNEEMRQEKERGDGAGRITGRWRDEGGGRRERSGKRETRDRKGGGKKEKKRGEERRNKKEDGSGKGGTNG